VSDQIILLLVEDEPLILVGMQDALQDGGYTCMTAGDGHEGLALIDANVGVAQALITDIRMEGPDGWSLARHARRLRPDIPIIYTTADSAPEWAVHGVPNSLLLIKPYAEAQLISAVSQLINAVSSGLGASGH